MPNYAYEPSLTGHNRSRKHLMAVLVDPDLAAERAEHAAEYQRMLAAAAAAPRRWRRRRPRHGMYLIWGHIGLTRHGEKDHSGVSFPGAEYRLP